MRLPIRLLIGMSLLTNAILIYKHVIREPGTISMHQFHNLTLLHRCHPTPPTRPGSRMKGKIDSVFRNIRVYCGSSFLLILLCYPWPSIRAGVRGVLGDCALWIWHVRLTWLILQLLYLTQSHKWYRVWWTCCSWWKLVDWDAILAGELSAPHIFSSILAYLTPTVRKIRQKSMLCRPT